MWQKLLVNLAIAGLLACPHQCAAKSAAALSLQLDSATCSCCHAEVGNSGRSCVPEDVPASPSSDCENCVCDGATVVATFDYSPDLSSSHAFAATVSPTRGGQRACSTSLGQALSERTGDGMSVGRFTRLAIQSLQL